MLGASELQDSVSFRPIPSIALLVSFTYSIITCRSV
jgi:hypothetical protein